MKHSGKIVRINLGPGSWGIESDDGSRLEPVNLADQFKEEGLRITFKIEPTSQVASISMWGEPVKIVDVTPAGE